MKRSPLLISTLVLVLALSLAGCGGSGDAGGDKTAGSEEGSSGGGGSSAVTTVEELKAALEADYGSEAWYGEIVDMRAMTLMGAPVLVVEVAWPDMTDDWDTRNANQQAISDAIDSYDTPIAVNIGYLTSDGTYGRGNSGGSGVASMREVYDLPPAPADEAGVKAWLDDVFGPGGIITLGPEETWYDSITSVEMDDVGSDQQLTVVTTLGPDDAIEVDSLMTAVQATGSPLTSAWMLAGGVTSGIAGGVNEPGSGGYLYPTQ